ncbi:hypothetical protein KIN20_034204 [Parelaphostrongylus tenuis]|uniref:Receptor expression-enhancing protein n=1 Tax=Parelaphostrongylus tenuis TaxID=148309 RepID=A0AAD5WJ18_PARTN|nr:hypothetical protein KIN20_034204 [Parelaphostrongylus tenuis]
MSSAASEATSVNPVEGVKKAHANLVASLYKSYGALLDEQLKKLDQAGVKREHVAYGLIGLVSLYLIWGQQAFFVSMLITFTYPATASVQTVRSKNGGEALNLLLYWVMFGFFALLDSSSICLLPAYFLVKTVFLVFLFLPQTQGATLIYQKLIDPLARAVEGFAKKK